MGSGATVTQAGLFLLPSSFVMLFAGPVAGWMGTRFGAKLPLLIGTAVATVAFGTLAIEHGRLAVDASTTPRGVGIGFSLAAMATLIVAAVPQGQTGVATGINTIMRTIGGSVGGQIAATIVAGHLVVSSGLPDESGSPSRSRSPPPGWRWPSWRRLRFRAGSSPAASLAPGRRTDGKLSGPLTEIPEGLRPYGR